ncbi:hypothetical protein M569_09393 [Genlisea aurea]|uniref:Uncharacterized protein n=1 Tax=Genlisea aurea TaxID=192259 RepID=S8DQR7_9LAMI|nr:hypothetical protein M569_09393 [Genlisea aurea]
MNRDSNNWGAPFCGSELTDEDVGLLDSSHADVAHGRNSDPPFQSCSDDSPENLDFSDDVLRYLNNFLLEDNEEDKAAANTVSDELSFDRTAISCRDDSLENPESSDELLSYIDHFLREDGISYEVKNSAHGKPNIAAQVQPHRVDGLGDMHCFDDTFNAAKDHLLKNDDDVQEVVSVGKSKTDCPEDLHFNDDVLKYINHILLEEDGEEKASILDESTALQATEMSLYEVIWGQHPASAFHYALPNSDQSSMTPDEIRFCSLPDGHHGTTQSSSYTSSSSNGATTTDSATDSPLSSFDLHDVSSGSGSHSAMQFNKEAEDVILIPDTPQIPNEFIIDDASRRKKSVHSTLPEGRSSKLPSIATESNVAAEMLDKVLVFREEKEESAIREAVKRNLQVVYEPPKDPKGRGGRRRGRNKGARKRDDVVDLRTLLTLCAQAVASEDRRSGNEYLRQIREHATPTGDGMQRVAHYFADGLQARLAGAGTQVYTTLLNMEISSSEILKAYHIYLATCPFRKVSNFFSNKTILDVARGADSIHIVDFGIFHGFQWPSLLQHLSLRSGGPPRVRFTGVDLPCPGFRPAQRVEETGQRLAHYARKFGIRFEFHPVAQKWETIKLEDINIVEGEVLAVSCLFRLRYLLDETVVPICPRDAVLSLIRQMNPAVFVVGISNGAYNGPFFLTRFREALFHYSAMFDVLDTIIPRDAEERMHLERVVLGREAMNAIACEAAERIERPETYKQWQVRLLRAGLEMLPLKGEITGSIRNTIRSRYHKDFVVDEDGRWLLQGWKGRVLYGLSSWRPARHFS